MLTYDESTNTVTVTERSDLESIRFKGVSFGHFFGTKKTQITGTVTIPDTATGEHVLRSALNDQDIAWRRKYEDKSPAEIAALPSQDLKFSLPGMKTAAEPTIDQSIAQIKKLKDPKRIAEVLAMLTAQQNAVEAKSE